MAKTRDITSRINGAAYKRRLRQRRSGTRERLCEHCGLVLSRYNPDRSCGPCAFERR